MLALANARILTPAGFLENAAVLIEGTKISGIVGKDDIPADADITDLDGQTLVPGFIDTQVNGGGGVLFNDSPTVDAIAAIGATHRAFGTTGFLPTLISDDLAVVRRGIEAVGAAIDAGVPGVLGIHIEGPFLNADRKGIHDKSKIRALDDEGFAAITSLRRGKTLVTLAPERTTPEMIRRLANYGVIVAAGHSDGSYQQIHTALDYGLTGFTHLFNAMSPLTAREPGVVGAALEDAESWCGLIVDGRHVHPTTMRLALRCKPADRFMLVTDAMPSVGKVDKHFLLQGRPINVVDGVCVNQDGTLAGSDLDMAMAVRNARHMLGVSLEMAVRMASLHPARFLGIDAETGTIAPGLSADMVLLDDSGQVLESWIAGKAARALR
ncbi:N-acetylglucosamine-6-phosphate deacetylase [Sphingomonas oleivorans]